MKEERERKCQAEIEYRERESQAEVVNLLCFGQLDKLLVAECRRLKEERERQRLKRERDRESSRD